jgi:hypothetical protein
MPGGMGQPGGEMPGMIQPGQPVQPSQPSQPGVPQQPGGFSIPEPGQRFGGERQFMPEGKSPWQKWAEGAGRSGMAAGKIDFESLKIQRGPPGDALGSEDHEWLKKNHLGQRRPGYPLHDA